MPRHCVTPPAVERAGTRGTAVAPGRIAKMTGRDTRYQPLDIAVAGEPEARPNGIVDSLPAFKCAPIAGSRAWNASTITSSVRGLAHLLAKAAAVRRRRDSSLGWIIRAVSARGTSP